MGDITFNNTTPSQVQTLTTFSVDPASPAIDGSLTPDDVLEPDPSIFIPGTNLGLTDDFFNGLFDNLNALSYGRDPIQNPLYFSVDRVAIGLPETDVNSQAQPGAEEAHGDVYKTLPPFGNNSLFIDEQQLGLAPGFFGDDLDALDLDTQSNPEFTFFSVDFLSFPNSGKQDDILVNNINNVYADGASDIGIDEEDDLDALILFDVTPDGMGGFISEPNGILDPGLDQALFSLSTFSPSTFTSTGNSYNPGVKGFLSPADILKTDFTGDFSLWAAASELGLLPDDELDTLDTTVADVPEPLNFVITKDVNLNKTVNLDINKNIDVNVDNPDQLATAEADAEAFGSNALAEVDTYTLVTDGAEFVPNPGSVDASGNSDFILGPDNNADGAPDNLTVVFTDVNEIIGSGSLAPLTSSTAIINDLELIQTGALFLTPDGALEVEYTTNTDWLVNFGPRTLDLDGDGVAVTDDLIITVPAETDFLVEFMGISVPIPPPTITIDPLTAVDAFFTHDGVYPVTDFDFGVGTTGNWFFEASSDFGRFDIGDGTAFAYAESTSALDLNGDGIIG